MMEPEIIRLRERNSKTYDLGNGRKRLVITKRAIHYPDDSGKLQDIDLTIQEDAQRFFIEKALAKVTIFKDKIGYSHNSRNGGRVDVELVDIDGNTNFNISMRKEENKVYYDNVLPGLDIYVLVEPGRTRLFKVLADSTVPRKFNWKISEDKVSRCHFVEKTKGEDNDKQQIQIQNQKTEPVEKTSTETGKVFNRFFFAEEWTGKVSKIVDKETRKKEWVDTPAYPITIDIDVNEDIVAENDDGHDDSEEDTWVNTSIKIGQYFYSYNAGFRFQTVNVPKGAANIESATLGFFQTNASTVALTVYGDDVDDAAEWSSASRPNNMTNTTASTGHTTAAGARTVDVKTIVQEIVARGSWAANNAMRFGLLHSAVVFGTIQDYPHANEATLDIVYKSTQTKTITCDAEIAPNTITKTITSDSYIKKLATTKTINNNYYIKKLATAKTINSDMQIGYPGQTKTINSNMFLGYLGQTKTITSDAFIMEVQSATINSNAHIKKLGYEGSINSDSQIKKLGTSKTINSDSYIKKLGTTKTINADSWIEEIQSQTINSNANLKATSTETINSDAKIKKLGTSKTITSDYYPKVTYTKTIASDCEIGWRKTINSNYHLKKTGTSKTIVSNYKIKRLGYEGSTTSDAKVKKLDNTVTINSNNYIKQTYTSTINSNAHIKRTYGGQAYSTIDADLVSLYHMDEPSWSGVPDEVIDSKGSSHGASMGLATTTPYGLFNTNAGTFSGTDTGINLGNDSSFHTNVFSVSIWVYPTSASNNYNDVVNSSRYRITIRSTRKAQWWIYVDGIGWIYAESNAALTLNKWTLLTATYDGTTAKLYVNGILQSTTGSGAGTIPWAGNTVYVGQSGGDTNEYAGRLEDLAFWNTALTQTYISSIWKEFTYLFSDAKIKKLNNIKTITSITFLVKEYTKTIASNYHLKGFVSATINSNAIIKKLGYEGSVNSNCKIKKLATSKTINSNAQINRVGVSVTINSNSYIKYLGYSATINSDAWIEEIQSNTINCDAYLKGRPTKTINSNYKIKKLAYEGSIASDFYIKKITTKTINSNANLKATSSKTINSDYKIKKLAYEGSITSDSFIQKTATQVTLSSAMIIKTITAEPINSNAKIKELGIAKTINLNSYIQKAGNTKTINSDSYLKATYTKTLTLDSYIKKTDNTITINCNSYLGLRFSKTINSNYNIKASVSATINSNALLKAFDVIVSINSNYIIKLAFSKTIYSDLTIRHPDATKPWVCAARYINKPIIVSANSLSYTETVAQSYHPRKTLTSDYEIS